MNSMRNIQQIVSRLIQAGHVLQCEKTKSLLDGGKQIITIGPYHTATGDPSRRYAMFRYHKSQQWDHYAPSAIFIAEQFVSFVGRDIARQAARSCILTNNLKPGTYGVHTRWDWVNNREVW